jgi:ketosteroid isomerase-like protein
VNGFSQNTHEAYIHDFNKKYTDMFLQEDFTKVSSYYADNMRIMPEFQATIQTKSNAAKYYQAFFERFETKAFKRDVREILNLGSMFMELGTFTMSLVATTNSYELKGKYVNIWKKDASGKLGLHSEAWNYDHAVDFSEVLKFSNVPSVRMALEPHIAITDNISFELAGMNALMEKIIAAKDGKLWTMFYDDAGKSLHSFEPMVAGRKNLDAYYLKHAKELPVFEKLDIRTDAITELDGYVLEYATAIANWRMDDYSGVSTSKNIRLWKRQPNGSLKIFRLIAMYDR